MRLTRRKPYPLNDTAFASERPRRVSTSALSRIPLDVQTEFPPPAVQPMHPTLRFAAWLAAAIVPWLAIAGLLWAVILLAG